MALSGMGRNGSLIPNLVRMIAQKYRVAIPPNETLGSRLNLHRNFLRNAVYDHIRQRLLMSVPETQVFLDDLEKTVEQYRTLLRESQNLHQRRREIAKLKRNANKMNAQETQTMENIVEEGRMIRVKLLDTDARIKQIEQILAEHAAKLPNTISQATPLGSAGAYKVIRTHGTKTNEWYMAHDEFATKYGMVDFESGALTTGARHYFLGAELAIMELALVHFAMDRMVQKGWTPLITPDMIHQKFVTMAGFQPREATPSSSQTYNILNTNLSLVGTSEHAVAAMYNNVLLPEKILPLRHVAFSHCYRTEAGSGGRDARGLYRVHQFSKVELFAITRRADSYAMFEEIVAAQESLYKELGLHYRVIEVASGDLGISAHRKVDIEAWMPSRNRYGEISSASNCTSFQSRRFNTKYKACSKSVTTLSQSNSEGYAHTSTEVQENNDDHDSKIQPKGGVTDGFRAAKSFAHTLNGTAIAVPRMLIAIIEQNQKKVTLPDGTEEVRVSIPEALLPYCMGIRELPSK